MVSARTAALAVVREADCYRIELVERPAPRFAP
jgi:hypothetical protein